MTQYIKKSALVAEIERLREIYRKCPTRNDYEYGLKDGRLIGCEDALYKINALEVKDVQCASSEIELKAHAEEYSFNIESELFMQLTPEQQKLWRKEIEQAVISGGHFSLEHGLNTQRSNICFQNIDDLFEKDGIDPNSKDIKIFKECYYSALEKLKEKKGE